MHKDNYCLRLVLLKKWLNARKGRLSLLAVMNELNRDTLYKLIYQNRISSDLLIKMDSDKVIVDSLEKECIEKFEIFRRFIKKGEGRTALLANALGMRTNLIRDLSFAKNDGRYLLLKYDAKRVVDAIRQIERGRSNSCYRVEKVNVNQFMSQHAPKSLQTLQGIMTFAEKVKQYADMGNHDGAVICEKHGDKYKVISIGFDARFEDMCRSHVCDKANPHLHGLLFASLGIAKSHKNHIGGLMAFSQNAPCPDCAKRLINSGINEVYCYYEPELMAGIDELGVNGIPVYKYQFIHKSSKLINTLSDKVA